MNPYETRGSRSPPQPQQGWPAKLTCAQLQHHSVIGSMDSWTPQSGVARIPEPGGSPHTAQKLMSRRYAGEPSDPLAIFQRGAFKTHSGPIDARCGDAVAFTAATPHCVAAVESGKRLVMVAFGAWDGWNP